MYNDYSFYVGAVLRVYRDVYCRMVENCIQPEAQKRSIVYLSEHLGRFLKQGERVLICFLENGEGSIGSLMAQAASLCGAVPVVWGEDKRWKTLLRLAFSEKVTAVVGTPLVILGLTKLRKYQGVPLYIRKVITAGYPIPDWMSDGIRDGMDCVAGGCFNLDETGIVAGFACGHSWGVHLRQEEYGVEVVDEQGNVLAPGKLGEMVLYPKKEPQLRLPLGQRARLITSACTCGSRSPRLLDMSPGKTEADKDLLELGQMLQSWTSVLDCRLKKSEYGLEMEIVCFQGEKLPKLPTAAKMVIRSWNPEADAPFAYDPVRRRLEQEK